MKGLYSASMPTEQLQWQWSW